MPRRRDPQFQETAQVKARNVFLGDPDIQKSTKPKAVIHNIKDKKEPRASELKQGL